jgi:predicted phage baseplate assembly protein
MEFDFLPKLPNSDLDDRTFKDLVEECLLRIPRYCPEWTNHNPGDPGITLIELFAWLTDQMHLRFNQVPRRNYVAFLELLGIRLQPPIPAHVELTFHLTSAQFFPVLIHRDTEVATERTATEESIIFSTDADLIIGNPRVRHFLTAETADEQPVRDRLRNRFRGLPNEDNLIWEEMGETALFTESQLENCFYLVLDTPATEDEPQSIRGNLLEIRFRGEPATGTGINPDEPPRVWQAWDGETWRTITRVDDKTRGFNFEERDGQRLNQIMEASIILHLPQNLPLVDFNTDYQGYWIRCVYRSTRQERQEQQPRYWNSPRIVGLSVQCIGGAVAATQCIRVQEELLGTSTGKPGQTFQLQMQPVLERRFDEPDAEYIEVRRAGEPTEHWEEVTDFGKSGPASLHYTIDSRTGAVQFGPLIRGPMRLKRQTDERAKIQAPFQPIGELVRRDNGRVRDPLSTLPDVVSRDAAAIERQYGKVPPPGSEIYMKSYRFGGGQRGNVQAGKLTVLRSSLPYVSHVVNYAAAAGGADAESLEEAVIRVPQLLRTRECAVTPEDFENVVRRSNDDDYRRSAQRVARAHCLTQAEYTTPGLVRLLVVPQVETETIDWTQGMNPERVFRLQSDLKEDIRRYVRDRRPLGIDVKLEEPEYVGVSVRANLFLEQKYNHPRAQAEVQIQLLAALYQFLNPITGGMNATGWDLGRSVYTSDIVSLCQNTLGVRHVGSVQLFEARQQEDGWAMFEAIDSVVSLGSLGLVCSWARHTTEDPKSIDPRHQVYFIE